MDNITLSTVLPFIAIQVVSQLVYQLRLLATGRPGRGMDGYLGQCYLNQQSKCAGMGLQCQSFWQNNSKVLQTITSQTHADLAVILGKVKE